MAGPDVPMRVLVTEQNGESVSRSVKYIYPQASWLPKQEGNWQSRSFDLESELPVPLPATIGGQPWNAADLVTTEDQPQLTNPRIQQPPGIVIPWHPRTLDVADFTTRAPLPGLEGGMFRSDGLRIVTHPCMGDRAVLMKIAPSTLDPSCLEGIATESQVYQAMDGRALTPVFLGHVVENGRVVGFVLEYIDDGHEPASAADVRACEKVLNDFHRAGYLHGDLSEDNFIVRADGTAVILDFEYSSQCSSQEELAEEADYLRKSL